VALWLLLLLAKAVEHLLPLAAVLVSDAGVDVVAADRLGRQRVVAELVFGD
jgi:hypothetical protein